MNRTIMLIVDDVEANRAALASSFLTQFTIASAANGVEAKAYVESHGADVAIVLLDIIMPDMNGIEFLKWLTASGYRNIPVVALTAEPSYQLEALRNGAWDFVVKPVEQDILQARVNNVLGRYGFLREKAINAALEAANDKLEQTKRQIDHLVNSIPGGIAIYRMTDRFETLYFSDGVAELSGHTREEYENRIGDDASSIMYPPDKQRLMAATVKLLQKGKPIDEMYRIYHKDGHLVWVHLNGLPMEQTSAGTLVYAVFQGMAAQTQLYQSVLDKTQTAVYACDVDTYDILYFNQKMATFAGVEPTSVSGKKCYHYFFHRDSPCTFCHMSAMKRDTILEREFTYPNTQKTYSMKGTLIDWNRITAHVEYIEDITQQKAAKAKNAALLAQLGSIMEHVPGALCLYKATGTTLEPLVHNKAFYETFGYSEEHMRAVDSKTEFLNVHPDDLADFKEKTSQAIQTSSPLNYTYRFFNDRKGAYIWLYMQASVMQQPDGVKLCYASFTDVTEERRNREQLINAQNSIQALQKQAEETLGNYQTLVNTMPGGIALYEIDGERVLTKFYSDGLCALSGYSREERDAICAEDAMALTYEEDVPALAAAIQNAIREESDLQRTYRIKTKSGVPHYVNLKATFVRGESGKAEFHAVFSDVDDMKRLEEAANEQQLRYEVAIKSSGINIWEYDIQTDCLTVVSNSARIKQNCYTIEHYVASTVEHDY
ncbi:MAG: PAS domain-containing protein, partial [Oscillospiraceae bacterium]|nr:PAS domain-containing protein [Oscillospiraceae bacterium]